MVWERIAFAIPGSERRGSRLMKPDKERQTDAGSSSRKIDDDLRFAREAIDRQYESWDELGRTVLSLLNEQARTLTLLGGRMEQVEQAVEAMRNDRRTS